MRNPRLPLLALLLCQAFAACAHDGDETLAPPPAALTPASAASVPASRAMSLDSARLEALRTDARRIASLQALPGSDPRQAQAHAAAQRLLGKQQQRLRLLSGALVADAHAGGHNEAIQDFLDTVATWTPDGQLQVLRPVLNELRLQSSLPPDQHAALQALLAKTRPSAALAPAAAPSPEQLEAWLHELLPVQGISSHEAELARAAREREWRGLELPAHTVLLSFDDGPHPVHTPQILATLAENGLKALFFQVGRNLGERRDGQAVYERNQELEKTIIAAGHAIGNHSYTHPFMPKLTPTQLSEEIGLTQDLLEQAVPPGPARTGMFRAPYGAVNEAVLAEAETRGLRLVLWNVDSLDWADPSPTSIVKRVMTELDKAGRGIVLMHDIHAHTTEALPLLIKELKAQGFHFAHWDGQQLVVTQ